MQQVSKVAPIPEGTYSIGPPHLSPHTGPISMCLFPESSAHTFGRSAFLIHGDYVKEPGTASHGCIVLPGEARGAIAASSDRTLQVSEDLRMKDKLIVDTA